MMEKLQGFATESKYAYEVASHDIISEYQEKRGDAWDLADALTINKRAASTGGWTPSRLDWRFDSRQQ